MKVKLRPDLVDAQNQVPAFEFADCTGRIMWVDESHLDGGEFVRTDTDMVLVKMRNGIQAYVYSIDLDFEE